MIYYHNKVGEYMKYKVIFFDLDGTLTDPREGIVNSIQYAADYYGIKTEKQDLLKYIGPPLKDTFKELLGERYTDKLGKEAVSKYRERYANGGIFENKIYPNVKETLALLKEKGFVLCTASSKPQVYVKQILEYFDIDKYFDYVGGATLDGKISRKEDVINRVIGDNGFSADEILMVGDRKYDLTGAEKMKIDAVGVLYGFGSYKELSAEKSVALIDNIKQLTDILK